MTKAMQSVQKFTLVDGGEYRPYTDDEIRKRIKLMLLSMQGSWTTQHHYSWKVQNSMYDEDCRGRVYMWRPNADNTRRLMCRSETLTNRTMFLIGRMALDAGARLRMAAAQNNVGAIPGDEVPRLHQRLPLRHRRRAVYAGGRRRIPTVQ